MTQPEQEAREMQPRDTAFNLVARILEHMGQDLVFVADQMPPEDLRKFYDLRDEARQWLIAEGAALDAFAARPTAGIDREVVAGEVVFCLRVGGEHTHLTTHAAPGVDPQVMLAKAIAALQAEAIDAANCPMHTEPNLPRGLSTAICRAVFGVLSPHESWDEYEARTMTVEFSPLQLQAIEICDAIHPLLLAAAKTAQVAPAKSGESGAVIEECARVLDTMAANAEKIANEIMADFDRAPRDADIALSAQLAYEGGAKAIRALSQPLPDAPIVGGEG